MTVKVGALTPSYITVDPTTGEVGADFTGLINAQGVVLPAGGSAGPTPVNEVVWERASDGAIVAQIAASNNKVGAGGGTDFTIKAAAVDPGATVALLEVLGDWATGAGINRVQAQAAANIAVVIDDLGQSSFPQIGDTRKTMRIFGPVDTGVSPNMAPDTEQNVASPNIAGFVSADYTTVLALGFLYDGFFSAGCGWRLNAVGANNVTITFHNLRPAGTGNASAGWRGIVIGYA